MRTITKLRRNSKALSPIFATLILIAIAVIAGIVVYMFTSGYLASMTTNTSAGQEKLAVSGATYTGSTDLKVKAYVQNMAQTGSATITGLLVKSQDGSVQQSGTSLTSTVSPAPSPALAITQANGLVTISATVTALAPGTYTVTVTTQGGGSFVSPSFTVP